MQGRRRHNRFDLRGRTYLDGRATLALAVSALSLHAFRGSDMPRYKKLYFQVIVAMLLGVLLGVLKPEFAELMKPLGDAFVKLIKMNIAPIIFMTVAVGIAKMGS